MGGFATYEKNIESTVTTIKHTVRILLNSNRVDVENTLKNVPYAAKVSMIIGDDERPAGERFSEIIFTEEV